MSLRQDREDHRDRNDPGRDESYGTGWTPRCETCQRVVPHDVHLSGIVASCRTEDPAAIPFPDLGWTYGPRVEGRRTWLCGRCALEPATAEAPP